MIQRQDRKEVYTFLSVIDTAAFITFEASEQEIIYVLFRIAWLYIVAAVMQYEH